MDWRCHVSIKLNGISSKGARWRGRRLVRIGKWWHVHNNTGGSGNTLDTSVGVGGLGVSPGELRIAVTGAVGTVRVDTRARLGGIEVHIIGQREVNIVYAHPRGVGCSVTTCTIARTEPLAGVCGFHEAKIAKWAVVNGKNREYAPGSAMPATACANRVITTVSKHTKDKKSDTCIPLIDSNLRVA